jgi:surface protein
LDLSDWNVSKVTVMSHMFADCTKLESIKLTNWNTDSVLNMGAMFNDCHSLKVIDVSSFDTKNVRAFCQMFERCSSLEQIIGLNNFNTSSAAGNYSGQNGFSDMFSGCSSLTAVDVSSFDTSNGVYFSNMFNGCSSLVKLDLSNWDIPKALNLNSTFADCTNLIEIKGLENWNPTSLTSCYETFKNCKSLTSLNLSSFGAAKFRDMQFMFYGCSRLSNIDISSFNTSSLIGTKEMFYGCSNLRAIYVSDGWSTASVSDPYFGNEFMGCTSLVGGDGTAYSSENVGISYAKIDQGSNNPGYLTHIDKDVLIKEITLHKIADAIREAINTTSLYKPSEMPEAIRSITAHIETEILGGKW